jgi:hypothetical protein
MLLQQNSRMHISKFQRFVLSISSTLAIACLLGACTKHTEGPASDTLLTKTLVTHDSTPAKVDSGHGLVIDKSHMRTPEHDKLLARFEPLDVVHIYHDYRPLRKDGISKTEIAAFLKSHKITQEELLAILDEGDRLGWSRPR